jgi:hypothetical protein
MKHAPRQATISKNRRVCSRSVSAAMGMLQSKSHARNERRRRSRAPGATCRRDPPAICRRANERNWRAARRYLSSGPKLDAIQTSAPTAPRSTGHSAAAYGSCSSTEEAISAGRAQSRSEAHPFRPIQQWTINRCTMQSARRTDVRGSSRSNA